MAGEQVFSKMETKICYILSDVDESLQLEAVVRFIRRLDYEVSVILIHSVKPKLFDVWKNQGLLVKFIEYSGKKDVFSVFRQVYKLLGEIKPDIVHTHLFYATLTGMAAAKLRGIRKRLHTRHHSNGSHIYYPNAVRYDKICNRLSAHIIAITKNVANVLISKESVNPAKITVINHGFDFNEFVANNNSVERIKQTYSIGSAHPVIGVISRYDHWKGIQFIIPAFHKILKAYPNAKLILANARGNYENQVNELLNKYLPKSSYALIPFESDVYSLYKTFDVFVHVPISAEVEAYGQIYVEALAMKVPSVFTLSGVANDFIEDKKNALVVPYCDSDAIYETVKTLLENRDLRERIAEQGHNDVVERYSITKMIKDLDALYTKL